MQTREAAPEPEGPQHLAPSRFFWGLALVAVLVITALVVALAGVLVLLALALSMRWFRH